MKIHVKVFGHQHYTEHVGEVLAWQQSVEKYGAQPMQVPCVLLRTNDRILLVPLQTEYRWTEVRVEPTPEMILAFRAALTVWITEIGEDADVYRAMLSAAPDKP